MTFLGRIPDISRGLGKYTPALWRRVMGNHEWLEPRKAFIDSLLEDRTGGKGPLFVWARIDDELSATDTTGPATLVTNGVGLPVKWKYPWQGPVELLSNTFTVQTVASVPPGGPDVPRLSGTTTDNYALNLCEAFNGTSVYSETDSAEHSDVVAPGISTSGSTDYPDGFEPRPIHGRPVVQMYFMRETDGTLRPVFSLATQHDGTCLEP